MRRDGPAAIAVLVAVAVVAGSVVVPVPAGATTAASVSARPNDAGATATHRATATVGSCEAGDSLNGVRVDYSVGEAPADVSGVGVGDVQAVGIDTDGDGSIDTNVSDDLSSVSASNDGHTLTFGFGGSYSLTDGDTVVVEYADVTNPDVDGSVDVNVSVNPQSDPVCPSATTVTYERTAGEASVSADPSTAGATATHTATRTVGSATQGDALTEFTVNYAASDASSVSADDVSAVGLDTDGDDSIETDLSAELAGVSVSSDGTALTLSFDGAPTLAAGDRLVFTYGDVTNPSEAGDYTVDAVLNGASEQATLSVTAPPSATISTDPTTEGESALHTASIEVGANDVGDSLNSLRVDYTTASDPVDVSDVDEGDVRTVGIDTDGDGSVETAVGDDLSSVSASNDGHTLTFGFGGSYSLSEGDTVVVAFGNVTNPTAGTYDVAVSVNVQSDPVTREVASLRVESAPTDGDSGDGGTGDGDTTQNGTEGDQQTSALQVVVDGAAVSASPATRGAASTTHTVRAVVGTGNESGVLRAVTVDYTAGADPADVGAFDASDVLAAGLDTDGDGTVDRPVAVANVTTANTGETLTASFAGNVSVSGTETVVLRYGGVQNPAGAGNYTVGVAVRVGDQRAAAEAVLAVESSTTTDDGDATSVAVAEDGESTTAVIQNAQPADPVTVDFGGHVDRAVAPASVTVTFAQETNVTLRVDSDVENPVDVAGPDLGQFALRHDPVDVSQVVVAFTVGNETLSAADVDPENVVLVRRNASQWDVLDTRVVGVTADGYRFEASSPGLSVFAVTARSNASQKPVFHVTGTDLSVDRGTSTTARVVATVKNVGGAEGTFEARLTANGAVVAEKTLSLAPGATGTVVFEQDFAEPAVYDVSVNGVDAGVVDVEADRELTRNREALPSRPAVPPVLVVLLAAVTVAAVGTWFVVLS